MVHGTPTISQELAKWIADLRTQWSGKIDKPLSEPIIFLYTFIGALTLFSSLVFIRLPDVILPLVTPEPGTVIFLFSHERVGQIILVLFALTPSFWIAWLVSWPKRPYSPARLFLGGLAFSTLVCIIVIKVLNAVPKGTGS